MIRLMEQYLGNSILIVQVKCVAVKMKSYKKLIIPLFLSGVSFNVFSSDLAFNELGKLSELQLGYDNISSVEQNGAYNSTATVVQQNKYSGLGNAAKIKQSGSRNDAYIAQKGSGNKAYIDQNGDDNYAAVIEDGFDNTGVILQYGNNNKAAIIQKGSKNQGEIAQYGNDNKALIVQKSNVRYFKSDINQTGGQTHVIINGMNKSITVR